MIGVGLTIETTSVLSPTPPPLPLHISVFCSVTPFVFPYICKRILIESNVKKKKIPNVELDLICIGFSAVFFCGDDDDDDDGRWNQKKKKKKKNSAAYILEKTF